MAIWDTLKLNVFQKFTYSVVTYTETFFYKLGISIAKQPLKTIVICWVVVFLSAFGFLRFRQEKNPLKLWVPPHTSFVRDSEWLLKNFQRGYRDEAVLIVADDVLTPEVIQKLAQIHREIENARTESNITLNDVCFKTPKVDEKMLSFLMGDNETDLDMSTQVNPALYCSFFDIMKMECFTKSILELWNYDMEKIGNLTKEDIVTSINSYNQNLVFGKLKDYADLLGGIQRNATGHIIKASAIQNFWLLHVNFSAIDMDKSGNMAGTADWASEEALEWENIYLNILKNISDQNESSIYYYSGRSFGDISSSTMFQDIDKLCIGIIIMVLYVQLVISKFNWLEARLVLGSVGLLAIGMAFIVGCGICSLLGIFYGPVHTSLPFLLMGLGVDDMLVIMACWDELSDEEKKLPIPEKIGLMLKHAGVSITITSITDVIAFIIGASTILPCLESFCIYAACCVFMTFVFAITFFTACFVIDLKRIDMDRNGIIPCIKHKNYKPNHFSQSKMTNRVFRYIYSKIILTTPGKLVVVTIALVCLGFSIQGCLRLEQKFDPEWFLPEGTHMAKFLNVKNQHFPVTGFDAGFYMGAINYSQEVKNIKSAVNKLDELSNITSNVMSWIDPFRQFVLINYKHDIYEENLDEDRFNLFLSKFLFSPRYAKFQANFVFDGDLECGVPVPKIKISSVDFSFRKLETPRAQIPAMHAVRAIAENANFTTGEQFSTVWSKFFSTCITDERIDIEVLRNLELALLCVMACTILLIADWQTCFWIFICVVITMVNVCGFMQRWGLTIDMVSCIGLELAIGLCVDYASHIGHTFLTVHEGSRQDRSLKTVSSIGSAVLYGGLSTFIGMFMMSTSTAYTFQAFFKIFLLVIVFGLFHGIVLLPVILSWIGPKPYQNHKPVLQSDSYEIH